MILKFAGGFHNAREIPVVIGPQLYLPTRSIEALNKYFCGIAGCTCGGVFGNDVTIKDDEGITYTLQADGEIVAH